MMDAYVLGAVPPYNQLLGGKLVASLVRTREIVDRFKVKYGKTKGIISEKRKCARLVCVTTTSSLGKSSIYNRLKLDGTEYFRPIGFTSGWGHFQIPKGLFTDIQKYLSKRRKAYAKGYKFGQGPNWRLRAVRLAFDMLGINAAILRHNLKREIFLCTHANNASVVLRGKAKRPNYATLLAVKEVGKLARERWLVPRAERRPEFRNWHRNDTLRLIRSQAEAQTAPTEQERSSATGTLG
jgi:hypothetical protein